MEIFLKQNWFKIGIIIVVLVAMAATFYSYQDYLNRKTTTETIERLKKEEESKREYAAERKTDCLDIYKIEGGKWDNVGGWRYDENEDLCYVTYKERSPKSKAECEKNFDNSKAIFSPDPVPSSIFMNYLYCVDGTFEKSF